MFTQRDRLLRACDAEVSNERVYARPRTTTTDVALNVGQYRASHDLYLSQADLSTKLPSLSQISSSWFQPTRTDELRRPLLLRLQDLSAVPPSRARPRERDQGNAFSRCLL
jgi:hypothetical protein